MVFEYTRYKIAANHQPDFEHAYRKAQEYLRNSPYCDSYELTHCHEDRERYVLRIEWTSIEDHEQRFRHDPAFKDFLALVKPYIPNIEEMQHYEPTAVVGEGHPARRAA